MPCGYAQNWATKTVGATLTPIFGARAGTTDWRCVEINTDVPVRVQVGWNQTEGPLEPSIVADVSRTQRFYVPADQVSISAASLGSGNATVSCIVSDALGPQPVTARRHKRLAPGTYDSATAADDVAIPPFVQRVIVERSASGGIFNFVLSNPTGDLVFHDETTFPAGGVELAGATRLQLVVATAAVRLVWLLEM